MLSRYTCLDNRVINQACVLSFLIRAGIPYPICLDPHRLLLPVLLDHSFTLAGDRDLLRLSSTPARLLLLDPPHLDLAVQLLQRALSGLLHKDFYLVVYCTKPYHLPNHTQFAHHLIPIHVDK